MSSPSSSSNPQVTILGAGLAGLASAMFLTDRGADVTIVDSSALGSGASRGNAGYICSSIVCPLPGPGAIKNAFVSMGRPNNPLRVHPTQVPRLLPWFASFMRACTSDRFVAAQLALGRFNARTPQLVDQLRASGARIDMGKPLLIPFHDEAAAHHFLASLAPMKQLGCIVPDRLSTGDEMRALVPALTDYITCGLELPGERSIDPGDFVESMIEVLTGRGVRFLPNHQVTAIRHGNGVVSSVETSGGSLAVENLVLAAGSGIRALGRMIGVNIPVIPGQGYNVLLPSTERLTHPLICEEAHSVATPLPNGIRLGGTMEFGGLTPKFDQKRVDAIIRSMRRFLDLDWDGNSKTWAGSRPMSSDGLPLIGRPRSFSNVVIAGGHGMYGLTLSPTTGAAVAELVVDGRSDLDLSAFDPNRF